MKASALKGKAVISMADGVQIGRVEDVLFDTAALRVAALVLTTTGGRSTMPFAAIRSLGTDAVTVESATATQAVADQADAGNLLRGLGDLMGLKVVNGEGAGSRRSCTISTPWTCFGRRTSASSGRPHRASTERPGGTTERPWRSISRTCPDG
jgi:sporulation protein YlmC with PRC-barrel domain